MAPTRRWYPVATEVMPPKWIPVADTIVTHPRTLDPATMMALDERTWPRGSNLVLDDKTPAPAPSAKPPRYELGPLLGRGGMGEVHAAYDSQIGRSVAIKRLHPDKITPSSLARFLVEARIQGWLDHPAIPSVYELGSDEQGRPFFVMKLLCGTALDEILGSRATSRFTEQQLLRAFVEICLAVEFAHTRGVIHRDLKPANMLLGEFGEVYVLDWGVAHFVERAAPTRTTLRVDAAQTAGALGTPGYMSPEQVSNEPLDARADVYALGCVLFEILVGQRLHPAGFAGMTSALAGIPASPTSYRDDLAPELDDLCRRATAGDREQRIPSARALAEAVQRYLDGDRDLALRRRLAKTHLESARRASERAIGHGSVPDLDASVAMREAGRALALDPTLPGAAELVGRLMLHPSVRTPAAVAVELARTAAAEQLHTARVAIGIYAGYVALAPLLLAFGIRDAFYLPALLLVAGANIGINTLVVHHHRVPRFVTALGHAAMFALLARMFTPLAIAPGITAVTLMAYAQHPATRSRDLLTATILALVAVLGVFGAELVGVLGPTTTIVDGSIELTPPLDGITRFPIIPALCCYLIVLIGVTVSLTFAMAQRGREARRKLHVQAWQLRQLVSLDAPRAS